MKWLAALAVVMLAGGSVVYVVRHGPVSEGNPIRAYWQEVYDTTQNAVATLQKGLGLAPGDGEPAALHPFILKPSCAETLVRRVVISGVSQVDTERLHREAPLMEDKPFSMQEGVRLMGYVRDAYRRQGLPPPTLSLNLNALCQGNLAVRVTEDPLPPVPLPDTLMATVLADVQRLLARATPTHMWKQPELPAHKTPSHIATLPPALQDEHLDYDPVAPLLPPPALTALREGAPPPEADWGDARPDVAASPWNADVEQSAEDDGLILAALVNGRMAVEGFDASMDDTTGEVWVPLSVMMQALDFPIRVDTAAGLADGWFIEESRTFRLDMQRERLEIAGKSVDYPKDALSRRADDLYVRSRVLATWFPLATRLDLLELRLILTSNEPLPVDLKREREAQWATMEAQRALEASRLISDAVPIPYRLLGMPVLRLDGGLAASMPADAPMTTQGSLALQAHGDALYGTGYLTLNATRDTQGRTQLQDATMKVMRQELTGTLFGPLKATTFEAGDIGTARLGLASGATSGRGIRLTNRPFQRVDDPDRFIVEGEAPVGWDVEVYQDQSLLAFQKVESDGRYRFNALPLRVGLNNFRVVVLGPQGEKRETIQRFMLGADMPNAGDAQYDVSVFQPQAKVWDTQGTQDTSAPWHMLARIEAGLTDTLAATLGRFGQTLDGTSPDTGTTAGLRASLGRTYLTADTMHEDAGGQRHAASIRGNLGGRTDVRLGYQLNTGFNPEDDPVTDRYDAEVTTAFTLGLLGVNTGITYGRTRGGTGTSHSLDQRTGLSYERWALTNTLIHTWEGASSSTNGTVELSGYAGDLNWRASVGYAPSDVQVFKRALVYGRMPLAQRLSMDGTLMYVPGTVDVTQARGNIRYDVGDYTLGLSGGTDTLGNHNLGLTFSTLLLPTEGGGYRQAPPNYGSGLGRAVVKVFVDDNGNGAADAGEEALPNVTVRNRSRGTQHVTDASGLAVVDNLQPYQPIKLAVDEATLPDIFMKSAKDYVAVVSHPGANGTVVLPVRMYGEVVGNLVATSPEGVLRPVGNLMVQLVTPQGNVTDYAVSEADGYFAMAPVPLGAYSLRLRPGEDRVSGYGMVKPMDVELTREANSVDGLIVGLASTKLVEDVVGGVGTDARVYDGVEVVP